MFRGVLLLKTNQEKGHRNRTKLEATERVVIGMAVLALFSSKKFAQTEPSL